MCLHAEFTKAGRLAVLAGFESGDVQAFDTGGSTMEAVSHVSASKEPGTPV